MKKNDSKLREVAEYLISLGTNPKKFDLFNLPDDDEMKSKMGKYSGRKRAYRALSKNFLTCLLIKSGMLHKYISDLMNIDIRRSKEYSSRFLTFLSQDKEVIPYGVFHPFYIKSSLMFSDHLVKRELGDILSDREISEGTTIYDWLSEIKIVNSDRFIWVENNTILIDTETGEVVRERTSDVFDSINDYIYEEDNSTSDQVRIRDLINWG